MQDLLADSDPRDLIGGAFIFAGNWLLQDGKN